MLNLRSVMTANAMSCLVFGGGLAFQPDAVANFLGGASAAPQLFIMILGILLIVNGLHLLWASRVLFPPKALILYFSIGDFMWVIASTGLMVTGEWITTTGGVWVASAVAIMVGIFGMLQIMSRKAMGNC